MTHSIKCLLAAALVTTSACFKEIVDPAPLGPNVAGSATVTAERVANGVKIVNGSTSRISYVVVNPNWLGLLASCRTTPCPSIASGASVVVPESDIYGFSASAPRLVVRYWPEVTSVFDPIEIEVGQ